MTASLDDNAVVVAQTDDEGNTFGGFCCRQGSIERRRAEGL